MRDKRITVRCSNEVRATLRRLADECGMASEGAMGRFLALRYAQTKYLQRAVDRAPEAPEAHRNADQTRITIKLDEVEFLTIQSVFGYDIYYGQFRTARGMRNLIWLLGSRADLLDAFTKPLHKKAA